MTEINLRKLAERLVKIVDEAQNDYDAVDGLVDALKIQFETVKQ